MSSLNLNKVILCGRLTADPELKTTPSGVSVTQFSIAVNRKYQSKGEGQPQADFINIVAWRSTAEFINRYFSKGNAICITGSIQTRTWQDQQGNKRYVTEVIADEAMFVDSKSESAASQFQAPAPAQSPQFQPAQSPNFEQLKTDDDLPY